MLYLCLGLIYLSRVCKTFSDAIDFSGPRSRWLKELWHIIDVVSYYPLYVALLLLCEASWWWYVVMFLFCWIEHEVLFPFLRWMEVWEWDEKLSIPWLRKLWNISNTGRE